ncbi:MAG: hypothetical protein CSB47_03830 [Proteobacteria bacterium]|nr:MAG: hypothetical protein CSB47_03830 [Pseudomonadota bacterium]
MKNNQMLVAAVCAALFSAGASANKGMDPVSQNEINQAKSLAITSAAAPAGMSRRTGTQAATSSAAPSSPEFLNVETHRFDKEDNRRNQRWADVTVYDYATDELIITVVDLDAEEVISKTRHKNMQPPLSQDELSRAFNIVFDDPEERSILNAEFKRITGETLHSVDQLQYKAFTFFADSMPGVVNAASRSCGAQRCAQLMLYTHDNVVFEVSPIVNLSAGVVTQRMGY